MKKVSFIFLIISNQDLMKRNEVFFPLLFAEMAQLLWTFRSSDRWSKRRSFEREDIHSIQGVPYDGLKNKNVQTLYKFYFSSFLFNDLVCWFLTRRAL